MRSDDKSYSKNLMRRKSPNWLVFENFLVVEGIVYRVSHTAITTSAHFGRLRHCRLRFFVTSNILWKPTVLSSVVGHIATLLPPLPPPLPPERHRIQDEYMSTKMISILIESMALIIERKSPSNRLIFPSA